VIYDSTTWIKANEHIWTRVRETAVENVRCPYARSFFGIKGFKSVILIKFKKWEVSVSGTFSNFSVTASWIVLTVKKSGLPWVSRSSISGTGLKSGGLKAGEYRGYSYEFPALVITISILVVVFRAGRLKTHVGRTVCVHSHTLRTRYRLLKTRKRLQSGNVVVAAQPVMSTTHRAVE